MKSSKNKIIFLNCFFAVVSCHVNSDYDAPQEITFYHSVDNSEEPVWLEMDSVKLNNINPALSVISLATMSTELIEKLKDEEYIGKVYRMKYLVKTSKGNEDVFYSFMKVDSLVNSEFSTSLVGHLDHSGSVISIKLYPKRLNYSTGIVMKNSTLTFRSSEPGPVPDLTSYLLKLEREREAKEKGATQDNRSFLAKYWMYLVPLIMFAILTGSNSEGAIQQQNR